jgi:chromosome segregation ATPase
MGISNLRLGAKIALGFSALLAITVVLGGVVIWNMNRVAADVHVLAHQNVPSVRAVSLLAQHWASAMLDFRTYGFTYDAETLEDGRGKLAEAKKFLAQAEELAKAQDMRNLQEASQRTATTLNNYEKYLRQAVANINELERDREVLAKTQKEFMDNAYAYLHGQEKHLRDQVAAKEAPEEITERYQKIAWINEVIDRGNEARIANWMSQARRDPRMIQQADALFDHIDKVLASLKAITVLQVNTKQLEAIAAAAKTYRDNLRAVARLTLENNDLARKRAVSAAEVLAETETAVMRGVDATDSMAASTASTVSAMVSTILMGLLFALILGIGLALVITREITRPITRVIDGLSASGEQVTSAASQVASSSQQMANGAGAQASSLEEVSSSLEELTAMTRQNADNAKQANLMASDASAAATRGADAMTRLSEAMGRIKNSSAETARIVKTIDEIAFQTNLLALNAAVEAARAGDAGKGFAVVAEEVRALAQRSADAAKNTASLIDEAQQNSESGVAVTDEVSSAFRDIVGNAEKVTGLASAVAASSTQQAAGIEQISTAVAQMDKVTQANAANAEESASASEELSAQATELNELVLSLTKVVGKAQDGGRTRGTNKGPGNHAAVQKKTMAALPVARKLVSRLGRSRSKTADGHFAAHAVPASGHPRPQDVIPLSDDELRHF